MAIVPLLALACSSEGSTPWGATDGGGDLAPDSVPRFDGGDLGAALGPDGSPRPDGPPGKGMYSDPCRGYGECGSGLFCLQPGASPGSGDAPIACVQGCLSDAECDRASHGFICAHSRWCSGWTSDAGPVNEDTRCVRGCTLAACDEGESCAADGHCVPQACENDSACPPNFVCGGDGAARTCHRKSCNRDDECQGACVGSSCFDRPGMCTYIAV